MRAAGEGSIAAQERHFQATFEHAPIGIALIDLEGRTLAVNRAACALLGYSEAELLATTLRELTHPDDVAANHALMRHALAGEIDTYQLEKRYLRKDGQVVWAILSVSLIRDEAGAPHHFISHLLDITERKAAEAERAETHLHARQVLERITDGFYALDLDWRFTYVNEAAERILDRSRDELLGKTIWEAFAPAIETPLHHAYLRAMATGVTETIEYYYPPLAGWFEVRAYPSPDGLSVFFRDVTASRKLEYELRTSEAKYRALVQRLPALVYVLAADENQTPLYFSPYLEELTGFSPEEAMERTDHWLEHVHPDDRARVAAEDERTMAAREPLRIEYRYRRQDGSYVWVLDEWVPICDDDGTVVAFQGVLLDISDRVKAEEERARLAAIVESAEDGILSCTLDGTILSWNHGAEKLFGYRADEAIGRNVAMLRPPEYLDEIEHLVERVQRGESVQGYETVRLTKDGRRIDVSLALSPVRDASGRVVSVASISRDVTALRQAERALRLRDRALAAAANGILITDPTLPDNPIVDANPAFTAMTGYTREEVLGRNCRFLQGPGTDPAAVRRLRAALAAGQDVTETLLNYRKDGTPFWNELRIAAVRDDAGKITHFVGVQTDVTERVRAVEVAETATRAKGLFLAMMSHELRTPLQAVLGYTDLLLLDGAASLAREQIEDLEHIRAGARRMMTLIDQLLDLSRMEAGRLELAAEPVDLAEIIEQVRQDIAPQIAAQGLALTIDLPASLPPALGDPERIRQILLNLAGNAVKFTEEGAVRITACRAGDGVEVAVRDTGIGISAEALPSIFEEFRQVDGNLTRRYGGAGLGLAIARKLAQQMGGDIRVVSSPGAGSTFTLRLPAARRARKPKLLATAASGNGRR